MQFQSGLHLHCLSFSVQLGSVVRSLWRNDCVFNHINHRGLPQQLCWLCPTRLVISSHHVPLLLNCPTDVCVLDLNLARLVRRYNCWHCMCGVDLSLHVPVDWDQLLGLAFLAHCPAVAAVQHDDWDLQHRSLAPRYSSSSQSLSCSASKVTSVIPALEDHKLPHISGSSQTS